MSVITSLIAANWQAIAGVFAMIGTALGLYAKGRSDAKAKAKLEDITNANEIRRGGAAARASVDTSPERLRQSDGWKRD